MIVVGLVVFVATDLAQGRGNVCGQVSIHSPGNLTSLAAGSPISRFLSVSSFGVGSVRRAAPTGPLSTSIYTTDRTLLPSLIRPPNPNPPGQSINAQRMVGSAPIDASTGRPGAVPPPAASTSSTTRYTPAATSFTLATAGARRPAANLSQLTATGVASVYLLTITRQSETSLVGRKKPVTSLAPAESGLLRDHMLMGEQAFRSGEYGRAMRSFRLASDLSLNSPETVLSMFHARFAMGSDFYSAAAYFLIRTLRAMPELPLVPLEPKGFYGQARDYGEQVARLEEHCQHTPDDGEAQLVLAYFKWFDGDVDAAVQALTHANAAAGDSRDPSILEAVDTFWDGMVASGLVEGRSLQPSARQDEPEPPQAPPTDQGLDEPQEPQAAPSR